MRTIACLFLFLLLPAFAAEHTIAVVGLVHSHVWGHLKEIVSSQQIRLVGVAETEPELVAEAQKRGVPANLIFADWKKMIDQQKPEIVWSFVENNRHREIVEYCAPRKIHVLFEKPLASNYKEALAIRDLARKHGFVKEVRGFGLMIGVELTVPGKQMVLDAMAEGLLINCTHDTVLRFLPPYIVTEKEVDQAIKVLAKVFAKVK